jgi:hypothetical protein
MIMIDLSEGKSVPRHEDEERTFVINQGVRRRKGQSSEKRFADDTSCPCLTKLVLVI